MATKRQKKDEAKARVRKATQILPVPIRKLPSPLRVPAAILTASGLLAEGLIEADPLNIITDAPSIDRSMRVPARAESMTRQQAIEKVVNDPSIQIEPAALEMINDPSVVMINGEFARLQTDRSRQFDFANIAPTLPTKRTRKKTNTDKNMSKALRLANQKFRKKNGQLRSGATQAQIMKYAHKLLRRMSK